MEKVDVAQIEKEASAYEENLSSAEVETRLDNLYRSPGGFDKIAQQMLSPLKRDLLYEGRIRQILQTYKLTLGEEAVFDADVAVPAAAISLNGLPYQSVVTSDRIRIDTSVIATKPLVRWNESNFRKFDILNTTQQKAKSSIQIQEDLKGYKLIKYASALTGQGNIPGLEGTTAESYNPSVLSDTSGKLSMNKLTEGIVTLRSKLLNASKIWINPLRGKDFMLFNTSTAGTGGAGIFAPNFQDKLLKEGKIGNIWGCEVIDCVVVPAAEVYVLAPSDYIGVIAVRTDLSVETMKDVNQMADIMAIWEDLGFAIRFAKGIVRIDIS
jgi:hypothetical protein